MKNFIGIYENAFTRLFCDKVINYFDLQKSAGLTLTRHQQGFSSIEKNDIQLYSHDEGNLDKSAKLITEFNKILWEQIYPIYATDYPILAESDTHKSYAFKIQKTEIGQAYHRWHYESDSRLTSNRLLAWTLYLNDVVEGGETEFLYFPVRIKPQAGTFVIFPAAFTHTHRGNQPLSNTKYIVTGWIEF